MFRIKEDKIKDIENFGFIKSANKLMYYRRKYKKLLYVRKDREVVEIFRGLYRPLKDSRKIKDLIEADLIEEINDYEKIL